MSDGTHLTTWVTRETKERFAAVARHQGLSDSALLKRLVELMLQSAGAGEATDGKMPQAALSEPEVSVRRMKCQDSLKIAADSIYAII
jgi:hypothetical protein